MPFQSTAQQGFLEANKPAVAKKFADKTPKAAYKKLPVHKKKAGPDRKTLAKVKGNMQTAFGGPRPRD